MRHSPPWRTALSTATGPACWKPCGAAACGPSSRLATAPSSRSPSAPNRPTVKHSSKSGRIAPPSGAKALWQKRLRGPALRRPLVGEQLGLLEHRSGRLLLLVGRIAVIAENTLDDRPQLRPRALFHRPVDA